MLWDISGADGLAIAQTLFGQSVSYLAPFQSLETVLEENPCSVLRLCNRNFRILSSSPIPQHLIPQHLIPQAHTASIHQYSWLQTFSISPQQLHQLTQKATVRAPHRLTNLPNHQAVPAQLDDIALLIWQHSSAHRPSIDIHTSHSSAKLLESKINSWDSHSLMTPQRPS
ncbi:MAG: hypothetical protein ACFB0D_20740 [Phormidesmis sp.]